MTNKIIMLGTGNGAKLNLYNTCFIIQNVKGNFLVDTGGGNKNNRKPTKSKN